MPVLFAAEVDRIQTVLFRASRQRQVIGGSRLLYHLGKQATMLASKYGVSEEDVLKSGGGSFLIRFPDLEKARQFGQELSGACRLILDASITITDPQHYDEGEQAFKNANAAIRARLKRAKREARIPLSTSHTPTTAFCQASGVGLASIEGKDGDGRRIYQSHFAKLMENAGSWVRKDEDFLQILSETLDPFYKDWGWPSEADDVAKFDEIRGNVAYLVADGNSMGRWFDICGPAQVRQFANAMDRSVQTALGLAANKLIHRLMEWKEDYLSCLPFLPLIAAGDDVFVLLPAPYALDFARQFCQEFEMEMGKSQIVEELKMGTPTISAAVVFCKGSFPYHLAHERGEDLLQQAKRMGKKIAYSEREDANNKNKWTVPSAIAFDFISGGVLVEDANDENAEGLLFRPSAAPYWVTSEDKLSPLQRHAGLSIETLLNCRIALGQLPRKRLEELETVFTPENLPSKLDDLPSSTTIKKLERLFWRIQAKQPDTSNRSDSAELRALKQCVMLLGDGEKIETTQGHWRHIVRDDEIFYGHAMPDLLRIWMYAQDLAHPLDAYLEREEA